MKFFVVREGSKHYTQTHIRIKGVLLNSTKWKSINLLLFCVYMLNREKNISFGQLLYSFAHGGSVIFFHDLNVTYCHSRKKETPFSNLMKWNTHIHNSCRKKTFLLLFIHVSNSFSSSSSSCALIIISNNIIITNLLRKSAYCCTRWFMLKTCHHQTVIVCLRWC